MRLATRRLFTSALFCLGSSISIAEPVAQFNVAWNFGGSEAQTQWQANALLSQGFEHNRHLLPVYQYSLSSTGTQSSQLIGAPAASGINPLNVDGGFSLSTVMIMGGFIAAGLVIADELSDDETPPVAQEDGGE